MPIFAYRCDSCGFEKDVLQKRSDPPLDTCPTCSRETFRKRLSAPAFQLKGSGWYVTDFRDNGKAKAKPGESGDAAGADAKAPADAKTSAVADGGAAKSAEPASSAPAAAPAPASPTSGSQGQPG